MIPTNRWRPAGGLSLEPNAMSAAMELKRSLALTAGPGAGKTEMLAQRADFLFRTGACRYPQRILAISFKSDASKNLKARVRVRCGPELASRLDCHTFHAFAKRIIDKFRPILTGTDALDADYGIGDVRVTGRQITFDDMVPLAVQILKKSALARNAVRQTFSDVFLDEFQDCTLSQYQLIKVAFKDTNVTLTAVGDTKQKIMGWAGALEGIFQIFAKDFDAIPLNLYQNFRSKPRLRRMQNEMVKVMDAQAAVPDEELAENDGLIEILQYSNSQEEAEELATMIASWIKEDGIDPSEIAVLVSKQLNLYCDHLLVELGKRKIPYRNEDATQELSSEPIAGLIVDFLLIVAGTHQHAAHTRLVNLIVFNSDGESAEYEARARWDSFVSRSRARFFDGGESLSKAGALERLVQEMLAIVGRDAVVALAADYEHGSRLSDLIDSTVSRLKALLLEEHDPSKAFARFSGDSAVKIMTIHKSKGLEFDTVIILGVEKETFWGKPIEERSAFFVGISRAKNRLYLTVSNYREWPNSARRWDENRTGHEEFLGYTGEYEIDDDWGQ